MQQKGDKMRIPGLKNKGFINKISTNAQDSAADILKNAAKSISSGTPGDLQKSLDALGAYNAPMVKIIKEQKDSTGELLERAYINSNGAQVQESFIPGIGLFERSVTDSKTGTVIYENFAGDKIVSDKITGNYYKFDKNGTLKESKDASTGAFACYYPDGKTKASELFQNYSKTGEFISSRFIEYQKDGTTARELVRNNKGEAVLREFRPDGKVTQISSRPDGTVI